MVTAKTPASLVRMTESKQRRGLQPDPSAHGANAGASPATPPPRLPTDLLRTAPSASADVARVHAAAVHGLMAGAAGAGLGAGGPVVFGPGGRVETQAGAARNGDPLPHGKVSISPLTNSVSLPLRTTRGLNSREHHMARSRRVKAEHEAVTWALIQAHGRQPPFAPPLVVTLTRYSPSIGLDDDNLQGALKAVRDAIAAWLGIDDKHTAQVRYAYAQQRKSRTWAVRIDFAPMTEPTP